ncbi:MAG TPA: hypothetical protein VGI92_02505, partial [Gemmatimonadales bacterium]
MIYAVVPLLVALAVLFRGRRLSTLLLIIAYLSIEGFLKLISNYNKIVHVGLDVIVISFALYLILIAVVEHNAALDELPYTRLILVYCLWIVLQLLNPFSPGIVQSIATFKVHLTMVPLYFIAATLFRDPRDVLKFAFGLTVIMILPYAMALLQYALGPSSVLDLSPRFWSNISYYHEWRPFGTSAMPGGTSVFAYLAVPFSVALLASPVTRQSMKPICLLSLLLAVGTFVVSGIRQVLLGCLVAVAVMAVLTMSRRSGRIALATATLAIIGFAGYLGVTTFLRPMANEAVLRDVRSPEIWRERDVTQRLFTLTSGSTYSTARDNPWPTIVYRASHYPFGAGLGRTGSALGAFQEQIAADATSAQVQSDIGWADNFAADEIAEAGIPGLVMIMWLLIGMLVRSIRLARRAEDPTIMVMASALAGFYVSILAMSYGSQPLLGNPITAF